MTGWLRIGAAHYTGFIRVATRGFDSHHLQQWVISGIGAVDRDKEMRSSNTGKRKEAST